MATPMVAMDGEAVRRVYDHDGAVAWPLRGIMLAWSHRPGA